jgi:hypothetical protein
MCDGRSSEVGFIPVQGGNVPRLEAARDLDPELRRETFAKESFIFGRNLSSMMAGH